MTATAQDDESGNELGLPGDNFNLAAAMDIFQQSKTLEEFEEKINSDNLKLNNLDLNNDGQTDYIKVINNVDGDLHNIVLQTDINEKESQDIAVFYVEKKEDRVTVQAIGDEELYGKDYVIEPNTSTEAKGTANQLTKKVMPMMAIPMLQIIMAHLAVTAPSLLPRAVVGFLYGPTYIRWHSPWHWGYYPRWWKPWRPFTGMIIIITGIMHTGGMVGGIITLTNSIFTLTGIIHITVTGNTLLQLMRSAQAVLTTGCITILKKR
ncbi:MAG: hypothetical protein IPJ79_09745 [Bacteroidetes bacterium]|nr:hypothetical protein [Bacteroidota bacterium]